MKQKRRVTASRKARKKGTGRGAQREAKMAKQAPARAETEAAEQEKSVVETVRGPAQASQRTQQKARWPATKAAIRPRALSNAQATKGRRTQASCVRSAP